MTYLMPVEFEEVIEDYYPYFAEAEAVETCDGVFIKIASFALKAPSDWGYTAANHFAEALRRSGKTMHDMRTSKKDL